MMTKELEELSKRASKAVIREETFPDGTKVKTEGPFVYGYSMTIGPDGKPKVREFGNLKAESQLEKPQLEVKEERETLTDVIDVDDKVRVIVELPGVQKEDIKISGKDDRLTISVETPQHKHFKEVELPAKVYSEKATSEYKNGVLDITVQKKKQKKTKSKTIKQ